MTLDTPARRLPRDLPLAAGNVRDIEIAGA
jgi:hypothetical protein